MVGNARKVSRSSLQLAEVLKNRICGDRQRPAYDEARTAISKSISKPRPGQRSFVDAIA